MTQLRSTIARLLSNMGSAREIQLYLKRFSQLDAARFAVVRVGGAVLRDDLEALVSSLAFLQQVGLTPIVVHGAGRRVREEIRAAGIEERWVDGRPYTTLEELRLLRRVLQLENMTLVEALQGEAARATSIPSGIFEAVWEDRRKYGFLGRIVSVHVAPIEAGTAAGSIPVIAALGETADGQLLAVGAESAADWLVRTLEPYKVIYLSPAGGLLDGRGKRIESINLTTEYEALVGERWLDPETRLELERIHALLQELPVRSSVSITRPDQVAKELFTHRGSGTLVRRGERILGFGSWEGVDRGRLGALIESSFGQPLVEGYFQAVRPHRVYLSEHHRAAIVLTRSNDLTYMDKFAVSEEAQGEGLGRAIWQVMRAENPQLFWRSRRGNPVNEFYFLHADGAVRDDRWTVFWYGMPDWDAIRVAVEDARSRPPTLQQARSPVSTP